MLILKSHRMTLEHSKNWLPWRREKSPAKVLRPGEHSACKELGWRAVEAGGWATKGLASILSLMKALEI